MRVILASLLVFILVACGGGGDSDSGAEDFAVDLVETMMRGQWGRAWESLHPAHQAIASRDAYIDCRQGDSIASFEVAVDDVFEESVNVQGIGELDTTAITLELSNDNAETFLTMHAVEVEDDWVWFMKAEDIASYEAGECP